MTTIPNIEIAANLASLNEIIAEVTQALADHGLAETEFAKVTRNTLREHSHALGFEFAGEPVPADFKRLVDIP